MSRRVLRETSVTVVRASQGRSSPAHALQRSTVAPGETALETTEGLLGRRLLMLLCCAGAPFLIMLDTNIVAVSLPSIARDLHGTFTDVEWVVSAYILPFAALLMPAGALADRFGRRRVLLIGLSIFTIASFLCGVAPNLWILNGARALQAVGAALQLSSSLAAIAHEFGPKEKARVYAIWGTVMGVAPPLGPIVGGLVTAYLGWRWAFYINVPLGAGLITLGAMTVQESRDPKASRLDSLGILLFGTGLFSIVWALIGGNSAGWLAAETVIKFGVGAMLLVAFVIAERLHPRPMVDLTIFRDPVVVGAAVAMLGYAASAQVMMTILPLYLQDAFNHSPAMAGLAMIPFALPLLIGPGVGGKLAAHLSSRSILSLGLWLVAIGDAVAAAAVLADLGYPAAALGMLFTGCGSGLLNSETAKAQITSLPPERAGMAGGLASVTRFIGIISGVTGLGAVLSAVAEGSLRRFGASLVPDHAIDWRGLSLRIVGGDAGGALSALQEPVRAALGDAVHRSVALGFGAAFTVAAFIAILASLVSWHLIRDVAPRA
jgi:EmrB/QacA subfamily drug resistance transporter